MTKTSTLFVSYVVHGRPWLLTISVGLFFPFYSIEKTFDKVKSLHLMPFLCILWCLEGRERGVINKVPHVSSLLCKP